MATAKGYRVKRAGWAPRKGGGDVHITRENQDQIPQLLTAATIRERVQSGAFEEYDTGVEVTAEVVETAELLEEKAGLTETRARGGRKKKGS